MWQETDKNGSERTIAERKEDGSQMDAGTMYQYKSKAFTHEAIICDFKKFVLDFEELTENSSRDKVGVANVMIVHMLLDTVNKVYPKVTAATRTPQKQQ